MAKNKVSGPDSSGGRRGSSGFNYKNEGEEAARPDHDGVRENNEEGEQEAGLNLIGDAKNKQD